MEIDHWSFKNINVDHNKRLIFLHVPKCAGKMIEQILFNRQEGGRSADHRLPSHYIDELGQDVWNNYFKFGFVRNPFDRLVSMFLYRQKLWKKIGKTDFRHYVLHEMGPPQDYTPQVEWVRPNNQLIDFIGKVENLDVDMRSLVRKLNVPIQVFPKVNVNTNRKKHYSLYYDDDVLEYVENIFKEDLIEFDYQFEDKRN